MIKEITQPAKLQKNQCGGVYFWLYGIAFWVPIQQKLTLPLLLFSDFAGWECLSAKCVIFYHKNTPLHYVRKWNHKCFKLESDKGRWRTVKDGEAGRWGERWEKVTFTLSISGITGLSSKVFVYYLGNNMKFIFIVVIP